jgi:phage shock protein C
VKNTETPKKLYRSRKNKILAGVCGGIAEYFNQDPTIIRIIFAILFLGFGIGLLAYIVAWVLIPVNPSE